jgi:methylated-DNA-[protein]-cysteine S-methyltransferase
MMYADLEARLRGFEPPVTDPARHRDWPPRGEIHYDVGDLPIGRMFVATRPDGTLLTSLFLLEQEHERVIERLARVLSPAVVRGGAGPAAALRQLEEYTGGRRRAFELRYDLGLASDFQRGLLTELASAVGYGRTTTYGALATAVGRAGAARAVGSALGANPLCVVLPCHRVLAGSGRLSGYAGGAQAKRFLLDLERPGEDDGGAGTGVAGTEATA